MFRKVLCGSVLLASVAAGAVLANSAADAKPAHPMKAHSMKAAEFAKTVAQGGMAEVELGNLAVERARNADVKSFAQRMVDDHSKAHDELKSLAGRKNWTLPSTLDHQHQMLKDRLSKLRDDAFDREYMKEMVKDHNHDVAMFRHYADHGDDPDLKAWAGKTLPTLEEHQAMARSTAKGVGASVASLTRPRH